MRSLLVPYSLIVCFLLGGTKINAQHADLPRGVITDSVPIAESEGYNYALYLPENYTTARKWPVVFVFDIEGKGEKALEVFRQAPGSRNFILIGANNVENTTYESNFYTAKRLFDAVLDKFSIDRARIYLAGFGGGGRLATAIASISRDVDGVIACGAALPGNRNYQPEKNDFIFIGMVGDEDGNYREMTGTVNSLKSKKFESGLLVYEGDSFYPPGESIDKALRMLILKSIARGAVPEGTQIVDSLLKVDMDFNRMTERRGRSLFAFEDVEQLKEDYGNYVDKNVFRERKKEIRKTGQFRKQRNDNYGVEEEESYMLSDYLSFLSADLSKGDIAQLPAWEEEIKKLEKMEKGDNLARQKMASRTKNLLKSGIREVIPALDTTNTDQMLFANAFMVLLNPDHEDAYLEVLRYSVKKGEYGMALFYLEQLLKQGFRDVARLNAMDDIALLRILPEYSDILEENGLKTLY